MKLSQSLEQNTTQSNFRFSCTKIKDLGASEYTLVSVAIDTSSSVLHFKDDLEKMAAAIVEGCRNSPRSANLLIRFLNFGSNLSEIHGFKELRNIKNDDYNGTLNPNGMTALFDAFGDSVEAVDTYGKQLLDSDYQSNSIIFVITDGEENYSKTYHSESDIKKLLDRVRRSESVESITVVLIGLTSNQSISSYLQNLKDNAGIDQYVDVGEVTAKKLSKLAGFVSNSVSSTSQSLGSGNSAPLSSPTF